MLSNSTLTIVQYYGQKGNVQNLVCTALRNNKKIIVIKKGNAYNWNMVVKEKVIKWMQHQDELYESTGGVLEKIFEVFSQDDSVTNEIINYLAGKANPLY